MAETPPCKFGIDGNRPLEPDGRLAPQFADPEVFAELGACFVRVNFVLGPWDHPTDTARHDGRTWMEAFDAVVDGLVERGIAIYGLIGFEAVRAWPGDALRWAHSSPEAEAWLGSYLEAAQAIVEHFHDRVWAFEFINEPNSWYGGSSSLVHPYWMARIMQELYRALKPDFDVLLVSGPLLAHDLPTGGDTAAWYLRSMYYYGIQDLEWEQVKAEVGTYPLDGVAYHPYVGQAADKSVEYTLSALQSYLDDMWQALTLREGADTPKRIYISEIGWGSDQGEDFQASRLREAFGYLMGDERVGAVSWFCLRDFPGVTHGLFGPAGLGVADRKPAYYAYQRQVASARAGEEVPPAEEPGEGEAPPPPEVPELVGRDAQGNLYQPIVDCYLRNGGYERLGLPFDNGGGVEVHRWGNGWVQDFQSPDGTLKSIIMLRDGADEAYILWGVVREHYLYRKGGAEGPLGYPVADQGVDEWGLPKGSFENGVIICRPTALLFR